MDIEQLKLVLSTVQGVTADAQTIALWWIVADKLLPIVSWLIVFFVLVWRIPAFIGACKNSDELMKWARKELGTGSPGFISEIERYNTENAIRDLIIKSKQGEQHA